MELARGFGALSVVEVGCTIVVSFGWRGFVGLLGVDVEGRCFCMVKVCFCGIKCTHEHGKDVTNLHL